MKIETQFNIGDRVVTPGRRLFVIGQIKVLTLRGGELLLTEYRSEDPHGNFGTWVAEKDLTAAPEYLPDLTRTAAALDAYDAFDQVFCTDGMDQKQVLEEFAKLEALGEAVGRAFGMDTADRNNVETCAKTVRPGKREPGPGEELSFVRRNVAEWKERTRA